MDGGGLGLGGPCSGGEPTDWANVAVVGGEVGARVAIKGVIGVVGVTGGGWGGATGVGAGDFGSAGGSSLSEGFYIAQEKVGGTGFQCNSGKLDLHMEMQYEWIASLSLLIGCYR